MPPPENPPFREGVEMKSAHFDRVDLDRLLKSFPEFFLVQSRFLVDFTMISIRVVGITLFPVGPAAYVAAAILYCSVVLLVAELPLLISCEDDLSCTVTFSYASSNLIVP